MNRSLRSGRRITAETFEFRFDGRSYPAQRGDTAASALTAAGVRALGRSIKYRRLRGLLALGPEEPNALLTVGDGPDRIPNVPAPLVRVTPGMSLYSQNAWPSLRFDVAAVLQLGAGFWGAGFYYKTFLWPSWRFYEGLIRRLAGLGPAPAACSLPVARVRHLDADVVIAGAGAAGLGAALAAVRAGERVILCEAQPRVGGELSFESATIDGLAAPAWVEAALTELQAAGATILTDTAVVSASDGVAIAHAQPAGMPGSDTLLRLYAPRLVNAMGAIERPLAFIGNDLPGVLLSGAAERLLADYGVSVGRRVVLFGNHDRLYHSALRLRAGGIGIVAIVDVRAAPATPARAQLVAAGVDCLAGHTVVRALGGSAVRGVAVAPVGAARASRHIACDTLLVSGGWSPALRASVLQPWQSCGAAAGKLTLAAIAGATDADGDPHVQPYWRSPAPPSQEKRQFVDLQNDVTVADLRQALAEGFREIEHVKRYTTLGVGTEQGRTGGVLGAAILAELSDTALATVGVTRARGPYQPVPMGALSGTRVGMQLRPARRTPLHDLHVAAGGVMELMSGWLRPRYYAGNGADASAAGIAEAARVRTHGGLCDGSTLGKLCIAGPDAAAFLDRAYLGRASAIAPGRARYAALLREDGMVLDDGLMLRESATRFLATASTSHLAHVLAHLEFHRDTEWRGRRIALTDVTECYAVIIVAGPASRSMLQEVLGEAWRAPLAALKHMGFLDGAAPDGAALRVLRASFTGELAYELHCPRQVAPALWTALAATGLAPFGLEALDILRVEKGYLTSSELNGQVTPQDAGLGAMLRAATDGTAPDSIGCALLGREALQAADRPVLVGVRAVDGRSPFLGGAQVTATPQDTRSLGYVTSSVFSPALGEFIGLALVARDHAAPGSEVVARDPLRGGDTALRIVPCTHVDPDGARLKA
jgi:sarcosine oxidase subunit alpha